MDVLGKMDMDLLTKLHELETEKKLRIVALQKCDEFISSATGHAAYGDSYGFFGRMRAAGEALPSIFEEVDGETDIKGPDRRVQPYIRSQLFIALVSELEDFLSRVLQYVLSAYPQKIDNIQINFADILELNNTESIIEYAIEKEVISIFYGSPKKFRKKIEEILSMDQSLLDPVWVSFIEMKARRDLGVHNQWKINDVYKLKIKESGVNIPDEGYLLIDIKYFNLSLENGLEVIKIIIRHCDGKFVKQEK